MAITIPSHGHIDAFAMIVDINGFTRMVERAQDGSVASYVHDVLSGGVEAVESQGGQVVGFMGDAFLGLVSSAEDVFMACVTIAKDIDRQCEWISHAQSRDPDPWHYAPGGPSLKIAIEYGEITATRIGSRALGTPYSEISLGISGLVTNRSPGRRSSAPTLGAPSRTGNLTSFVASLSRMGFGSFSLTP